MYTDIDNDNDFEDEETSHGRTRGKKSAVGVPAIRKGRKKFSYESNVDVQRWLREQTTEESKAPFNPTAIASLRDSPWLLSSLTQFYEEDLITDVLYVVKSGKEATVYCCEADPSTGVKYLAAKVYRPRMFRRLKNDAIYRHNRVQRDEDGRVLRNSRHYQKHSKGSEKGRAAQVTSWIEYEYQTQRLLYEKGANVPRPVFQMGNAVLMEYIGDVENPAPLLREVTLPAKAAHSIFESIIDNIALCLAFDRIHGDLSEYNILYWQGAATLIDFAQAIDPHQNPQVFSLLVRDIERVCRYFARYDVVADAIDIAKDMWTRYQGVL